MSIVMVLSFEFTILKHNVRYTTFDFKLQVLSLFPDSDGDGVRDDIDIDDDNDGILDVDEFGIVCSSQNLTITS